MSAEIPTDAFNLLNNFDLTGTDTSFPVLAEGVVDCVISDIKVEPAKKGGHNMIIHLKTAIPWQTSSVGNRAVVTKPAGFGLKDLVSLTPTDNYNPAQRLAAIKEAVLGDKSGPFGAPEQYIGKPVTLRIKVESSEQYGDQNRVAAWVKRK